MLNGVCIGEKMRRVYAVMNSTSFAQFVTNKFLIGSSDHD